MQQAGPDDELPTRPERLLPDDFWMFTFKVVLCPQTASHDWERCLYAHHGERARRRHPSLYEAVQCPEARSKRPCPRGEECPCTHHLFEYWLHPDRYLTCLCELGPSCNRPICFFAHKESELRPLPAGLTHNDGSPTTALLQRTPSPQLAPGRSSSPSSCSQSSGLQRRAAASSGVSLASSGGSGGAVGGAASSSSSSQAGFSALNILTAARAVPSAAEAAALLQPQQAAAAQSAIQLQQLQLQHAAIMQQLETLQLGVAQPASSAPPASYVDNPATAASGGGGGCSQPLLLMPVADQAWSSGQPAASQPLAQLGSNSRPSSDCSSPMGCVPVSAAYVAATTVPMELLAAAGSGPHELLATMSQASPAGSAMLGGRINVSASQPWMAAQRAGLDELPEPLSFSLWDTQQQQLVQQQQQLVHQQQQQQQQQQQVAAAAVRASQSWSGMSSQQQSGVAAAIVQQAAAAAIPTTRQAAAVPMGVVPRLAQQLCASMPSSDVQRLIQELQLQLQGGAGRAGEAPGSQPCYWN